MEPSCYGGIWCSRPTSILLQGLITENTETYSQVRTQPSVLLIPKTLLGPFPPQRETMWKEWFGPEPRLKVSNSAPYTFRVYTFSCVVDPELNHNLMERS